MALLLLCCTVARAQDFSIGGVTYNLSSNGEVSVIKKAAGTYSGDVVIPGSVNVTNISFPTKTDERYYSVTSPDASIRYNFYAEAGSVISLVFSTSDFDSSYRNYIDFEVYLDNSLKTTLNYRESVPSYTIETTGYHNINLKVTAKNNTVSKKFGISASATLTCDMTFDVTSISDEVFKGSTGLTSVSIGNNVKSIGASAFSNCTQLTNLEIPGSVTSIGSNAFSGCSGISSVTIPQGDLSIGPDAFSGCTKLSQVHISDIAAWHNISFGNHKSNPLYYATNDGLYLNGNKCPGLIIPEGFTRINNYVFCGYRNLENVTIPEGITIIGTGAFYGCDDIASVTIPSSVASIGDNAFYGCSKLIVVYNYSNLELTPGSTAAGHVAYYAGNVYNDMEIVGDYVFSGNSLVEYRGDDKEIITLPENFKGGSYSIGSYAFANFTKFKSIIIPNKVDYIGDYAFRDCANLLSVTIGSSVLRVGTLPFPSNVVKMIFLGNTPPRYSNDVIYKPTADIIYVSNSDTYGYGIQYSRLSSIFEVNGVRYVPLSTRECDVIDSRYDYSAANVSVDSVVVYGNRTMTVKNINDYSFYKNHYVKQAYVNNDGYVGINAFYDCDSITGNVTVENNGCIGNNAFYDCDGIESLNVANNGNVETYAFYSCDNLANATITNDGYVGISAFEDSFTKCDDNSILDVRNSGQIHSSAFKGCTNLATASITNGGYIGDNSFQNCAGLTTVTIENDGYIGISAFENSFTQCGDNSILDVRSNGDIKSSAFKNCTNLLNANIANDGNIGVGAFQGCAAMTTATIENNGYIGVSAFQNSFTLCGSDSKVDILNPSYIGASAFRGCSRLVAANLFNNGSVGNNAFQNCTGLANLAIGENVDTLGHLAFDNCASLKEFTIPDNVTSMGEYCFRNCAGLEKMAVGTGIKQLLMGTFKHCTSLTNMRIGVNVKTIENSVFNNCSSLPAIYIPQATKTVADSVFLDCAKLSLVVFENRADSVMLGSNGSDPMFSDCPLDSVYIGGRLLFLSSYNKGYSPFYGNESLRSVTYNDNETRIYDRQYMNCSNLQNVRFSNKTGKIGVSAFRNCIALPRVTTPDAVTKMGGYAFAGCSSLKQAIIGENTDAIDENTFADCVSLVDVKLGARIGAIARRAFFNCSALPEITIPSATASIADSVFFNCQKLARFYAEDGMTTLTMGKNSENVASGKIGDKCPLFIDCQLDSVYLGRNLSYNQSQEYGYSPFYFNKTLRAVVIGDKVKSVFPNQFYLCRELKYVSVGNGVTSVGDWAFSSCVSLDHFSFGVGLETIGKEAFSDCTLVTKIVSSREEPPVCGDQALADINMWDCTIYVPEGSVDAYMNAPQWCEFWVEGATQTYTLTYVVDGELYASYEIVEGGEITLPEVPVREGYIFSGWSEIPETMPAGDVTITGSFTLKTNTVSYVVDGVVYSTEAVAPGSAIVFPDAPAKEGYKFVGWSCETPDVIDIASNADAMLYTNAPCTNTQYGDQFVGWHVLFDGRSDTFFHSEYSDVESTDGLDHYIRVDMGENSSVSLFTFTYTNRSSNSVYYSPKKIVVEGSNSPDGDYEEIAVLSNLSAEDSYVYNSPVIGGNTAYRYIRYRVVETQYNVKVYNHPYFHIGEFGMANAAAPAVMPAGDLSLVAVYEQLPITSGSCGENATWSFADGVLTISGSGAMYDYMGGDTPWNDYRVKDIRSVVVEEGITHIGNSAFRGFEVAESVSLPNSVTSIGERAFSGNAMTSVNLPANLESIGNNAFYICTRLSGELVIPGSVTTIGESAFDKCSNLTSLVISYGVESIGKMAFNECTGLSGELVIPNSVTYIDDQAFLRCANITGVTLSENLTTISYGAFSRTGLTNLVIPEGVTTIEAWTFDNIPALVTLSLPSTLESVENNVFTDCAALESITAMGRVPAILSSGVFYGISSNATLYVPRGTKAAYEAADGWNTIPNIVEFVNTRLITYMVDGEVYATEEVEVGAGIEPVAAPEKELYGFVEWNGLPTTMPDEDIVVEAEYEQVAVKITIGAHGSTTYCSQYALDFSEVEGLKAYAATGFNINTGIITMTRVMTTVEGTGIFFKATSGTYIVPIIETSGDYSLNMLAGVLNKTLVKDVSEDGLYANYRYVRPTGETEYMFYRSTATGANVSAGKAYLQIPLAWLGETASKTIGVRFEEGELTDIDEVTDANVDETIVYDLNGRRIVDVESLEKGIYIINGKKVLVK